MADMSKLMELFKGQDKAPPQGESLESSAPSVTGDDASPLSSGMATPTEKAGQKASGRIQVQLALNVLGKALASFDNNDEEAKTILSVMGSLTNKFGDTPEKELVPAQILQLVKSEPSLRGMMDQKQQQPQPPQGV